MTSPRRRILTAISAITFAACDSAGPTSAPLLSPGDANLARSGNGASVVHAETSTPSGTGRRLVTLHAVQTPSGQVNGGYRIELTSSGTFFEVAATCVVTEGNTAWIGGIISATNSPAIQVGTVSYFFMVDNGKVTDGLSPDVMSTARINDQAGRDREFCDLKLLLLPRLPGLEGDLWVK